MCVCFTGLRGGEKSVCRQLCEGVKGGKMERKRKEKMKGNWREKRKMKRKRISEINIRYLCIYVSLFY